MPSAKKGARKAPKGAQATRGRRKSPGVAVSPLNGAEIPLGAHPGNTGGKKGRSGRPPSELRRLMREGAADRIPRLLMIADGNLPMTETCPKCGHQGSTSTLPVADAGEMLRANDMLLKYGLGERSEFSEDVVAENVDRMLSVAETILSEADFKAFARQTDAIWNAERRG